MDKMIIDDKPYKGDDEISVKEMILQIRRGRRYLLSKWKTLLFAGILGGGLGLVYTLLKAPIYIARCTFVLEDGKSGVGLGQYAGLAAMAGVDLDVSDGLFQGDNILELYRSRTMLQKTLLSYDMFDGKKDLLVNRYIKINKLKESWAKNPKLSKISFEVDESRYSREQDSIMTGIVEDINRNYLIVSKPDKKLSIVEVLVKSKDEQFAKCFSDHVVSTVNNFYTQTKIKKTLQNVRLLNLQADSIKQRLNSSLTGVATAMDASPSANPALNILKVPSQRKAIDVQINSALYSEIVKNLEATRLVLRRETPIIQIIDPAIYPLKAIKPSKILYTIVLGLICPFITAFFLLIKKMFVTIIIN